jgi:hypothetical protein
VQWLDKPQRYTDTEAARTAVERGVVAVVEARAEIFCLDCAKERELLIVGEILRSTERFKDMLCDGCHRPIVRELKLSESDGSEHGDNPAPS